MQFGEIVAPTIKELFVEKIQGMILSGRLSVGDRLPSERELAEEMKVSKTIVHLGLKDLERMGFIRVNGRQGTFVANYAETGTYETLNAIIKFNGGKLDQQHVASLLELRVAVEGQAVRRFAENHTDEDITYLQKMIDDIKAWIPKEGYLDRHELACKVFDFHHSICLRSKNPILPLVLNAFKEVSVFFWETSIQIYGVPKSIEHLDTFLGFLKNGQGEEVVKYMSDGSDYYLAHT